MELDYYFIEVMVPCHRLEGIPHLETMNPLDIFDLDTMLKQFFWILY